MSALESVGNQIENIPGFGLVSTAYEEFAPDYLKTKDPFYVKVDGIEKRRRAPAQANELQQKSWKRAIKKAWQYDRNFCCGGCVGFDIGLGIIPIINILPVIGPILAYTLQGSLIRVCAAAGAPMSVQAKMTANCGTDFLISLIPLLGVVFSWMFGCATRNAALFDTWLGQVSAKAPRAPGPHAQGAPKRVNMPWKGQGNAQQQTAASTQTRATTKPTQKTVQQSPTKPQYQPKIQPLPQARAETSTSAQRQTQATGPPSFQAPDAPKIRTSVAQYAPNIQPQSPASPSRPKPVRPLPVDL